ncbi:MAG: hypothetical protein RL701_2665, partial [Pseudomonadota bacterium]
RARSQHHTQLALARALEQPPVSMFAGLCAALACVFSALVRMRLKTKELGLPLP